jgi:hypothetical protein
MSSSTSSANLVDMPQELIDNIMSYIRSSQPARTSNCDFWSLAHTNKTLRSKILPALFEVIPITTRSYNDDYLTYITTEPTASMIKEFVVYDMPPTSLWTSEAWIKRCYAARQRPFSTDPLCPEVNRVHMTSLVLQQISDTRNSQECHDDFNILMTALVSPKDLCMDFSDNEIAEGSVCMINEMLQNFSSCWRGVKSYTSFGTWDPMASDFLMPQQI